MELTCPRCKVPLHLRGSGDTVAAHLCEKCSGVFIDGSELMAVCRTLAHLPDRRDEVAMLGAPGRGIASCPRCQAVPFELEVLEQQIDFCVRCTGTWLDGPEVGAMSVDLDARAVRRTGGYREVVNDSPVARDIRCAQCERTAPIEDAYVTLSGFLCEACHRSAVAADVQERSHATEDIDQRRAADVARTLKEPERATLRALRAPTFFAELARWAQQLLQGGTRR